MTGAARYTGRRAMVSGAGAGFGRATALGLAREGAAAVALVERDAGRLDAVCAEVEALGARPLPFAVDLADARGAAQTVEGAVEAAGGLDVLVSNHVWMAPETPFLDGTDEDWERQLSVNLSSHYVLARSAARQMRDQGTGGAIAFTASVDALGAELGYTGYCVTKTALVALARVMAVELAEHGIRVNCVSPGPGDTPGSTALVGEELMQQFRTQGFAGVPLKRLAHVDDIAEAFLYLCSDAAAFVTGQNLVVDGGLTSFAYHLPESQG